MHVVVYDSGKHFRAQLQNSELLGLEGARALMNNGCEKIWKLIIVIKIVLQNKLIDWLIELPYDLGWVDFTFGVAQPM